MLTKFGCCYELEYGGLKLGWGGIYTNIVLICGITFLLVIGGKDLVDSAYRLYVPNSSNNVTHGNDTTNGNDTTDENDSNLEKEDFEHKVSLGIGVFICLLVIIYLVLFLRLWASFNLLYGTKKRSSKHIYRYVIVDTLFFIPLIMILMLFPIFLIYTLYSIYLSVCIYSLYKKIKSEEERNSTVKYELTSVGPNVGSPNYSMVQNVTQLQQGQEGVQVPIYLQQQTYSQPQPQHFQQPQGYVQVPAYQPQTSKFAEANQLPPQNNVSPSAPKI
ncbi:unnamed protein product [Diamesa hyperborea]